MLRQFLVLASLLLAACSRAPSTGSDDTSAGASLRGAGVPATPPHIRGTVTRVVAGDSLPAPGTGAPSTPVSCPPDCGGGRGLRGVLIEEQPGQASGGNKSMVTMLAGARVLRRTDGGYARVGFADLRVGQRVAAWPDGPVAESYPSQARGLVVVIEP